MTRIEDGTTFAGAPEDGFDCLADPSNEPSRSACPTRWGQPQVPNFYAELHRQVVFAPGALVRAHVQWTEFGENPARAIHTCDDQTITADLVLRPDGSGSVVSWTWDVRLRRAGRLFGSLMRLLGGRLERRVWERMKDYMDSGPAAEPQHP